MLEIYVWLSVWIVAKTKFPMSFYLQPVILMFGLLRSNFLGKYNTVTHRLYWYFFYIFPPTNCICIAEYNIFMNKNNKFKNKLRPISCESVLFHVCVFFFIPMNAMCVLFYNITWRCWHKIFTVSAKYCNQFEWSVVSVIN